MISEFDVSLNPTRDSLTSLKSFIRGILMAIGHTDSGYEERIASLSPKEAENEARKLIEIYSKSSALRSSFFDENKQMLRMAEMDYLKDLKVADIKIVLVKKDKNIGISLNRPILESIREIIEKDASL